MTRLALIQMVSSCDPRKSLERLNLLLEEASSSRPDAIFLPENFLALGHADPKVLTKAGPASVSEVRQMLSSFARESNCLLFAGTLPMTTRPDGSEVEGGRVRAASFVYNGQGEEIARYDKMHMFDVRVDDDHGRYMESATFEAGTEVIDLDTSVGKVGLSVCYDIRFPEFYRVLFDHEVDIVTVPSAFTVTTGEAHFEVLMRARAIENSCFMVASCQGGTHDSGRKTWGHSMVVDPWGEVLGELGQGEGVLEVEIDRHRLDSVRSEMPFREQRKLV